MSRPRKRAAAPDGSAMPTPSHHLQSASDVRKILKVEETSLMDVRLNELMHMLYIPPNTTDAVTGAKLTRAIELYESLTPADGAEGMLASQMVGTHMAAVECLRRANLPSQTFDGREMNLKHAQKLMSLYAQQLAALNKHRGKGQQKVTVEHVHVEAGGQAIVGNVETGSKALKGYAPPALEESLDLRLVSSERAKDRAS